MGRLMKNGLRVIDFLFLSVVAFFILWHFGAFPTDDCISYEGTGQKDCTVYGVAEILFFKIKNLHIDTVAIANMLFAGALVLATSYLVRESKSTTRRLDAMIEVMRGSTAVASTAADNAGDSVSVARDTLVATNRPWLNITGVEHQSDQKGPYISDGLLHLPVKLDIKNIGFSPAQRIKTFMVVLFNLNGMPVMDDLIAEYFRPMEEFWKSERKGNTLFHGESAPINQDSGGEIPGGADLFSAPWHALVGVSYVFPFEKDATHYTATLWKIGKKGCAPVKDETTGKPIEDGSAIYTGKFTFKKVATHGT
jgi:hypothetical protein